jgi:glycosyltransferase involved in cell wall biosynthesis
MKPPVSLVIPGRDTEGTIDACLGSVVPLLGHDGLEEIVFVDDGSTDGTRARASAYPVRLLAGEGRGPGAARNLGWRAARGSLIWFVDADCVAEPDALAKLIEHMADPKVAGVGGSYGNMRPDRLVPCLIHEEIVARHRRMPAEVDFLATFNVLYRREALEAAGGFDERFLKAQDAELAYRVTELGHRLRFESRSRVNHFHADRLLSYLRTQAKQAFWRVRLYVEHPVRARGDAYSSTIDHVQPPLALAILGLLPLIPVESVPLLVAWGLLVLLLAQLPMTSRLVRETGRLRYVAFAPFGVARAFARGLGMAAGLWPLVRSRRRTA